MNLSEKLRPTSFSQVVGQEHLTAENGTLSRLVKNKHPVSILLFGPPGSGKTTIARIYSNSFDATLHHCSAVTEGVAEFKKILKESKSHPLLHQTTILFIDEIHRLNKAQQDVFLPHVENGSIILIGATTENPSFAINHALISRMRVFELYPLSPNALSKLFDQIEIHYPNLTLTDAAKTFLIEISKGDARHFINLLEDLTETMQEGTCDQPDLEKILQRKRPIYDKHGEYHYNLISALHKSIRGSDPDAALYWLSRMLVGGEDPDYLLRRLARIATEDIGLADPYALQLVTACWETYNRVGSPEGEIAIAQATVYLALAPKSNALYTAFNQSWSLAEKTSHLSPPKNILNAPTKLMKDLNYGKGYVYDHETKEGFSGQNYFPDNLFPKQFYQPTNRGFEKELNKRLQLLLELRSAKKE